MTQKGVGGFEQPELPAWAGVGMYMGTLFGCPAFSVEKYRFEMLLPSARLFGIVPTCAF
jgi:hypothetical protein